MFLGMVAKQENKMKHKNFKDRYKLLKSGG
jgi:hypothetical protein